MWMVVDVYLPDKLSDTYHIKAKEYKICRVHIPYQILPQIRSYKYQHNILCNTIWNLSSIVTTNPEIKYIALSERRLIM